MSNMVEMLIDFKNICNKIYDAKDNLTNTQLEQLSQLAYKMGSYIEILNAEKEKSAYFADTIKELIDNEK